MSVADPIRLTRRDRAALVLALLWLGPSFGRTRESLRKMRDKTAAWCIDMALDALDMGGDVGDTIREAFTTRAGRALPRTRLLRARLALLLRAVLRADAGDFGPSECLEHGLSWHCPEREESRRIVPLWESAPRIGR